MSLKEFLDKQLGAFSLRVWGKMYLLSFFYVLAGINVSNVLVALAFNVAGSLILIEVVKDAKQEGKEVKKND